MKHIKTIEITLIGLLFITIFSLPISINAKTINQFEEEIKKYTQDLENKKSQIITNETEKNKVKNKISSIENQIKKAEQDIKYLEKEIEKNNKKIAEKDKESKRIIEYYQISNGTNAYLEYAFGAKSITDMIYRLSVVEQLTDKNDKIMKELEKLTKENKKQQEKLNNKKQELLTMKDNLIYEQQKITSDIAYIKAGMPGIEEQIKAAKNQLEYYKKLGCRKNEDIQACQYRIEQESHNSNNSLPSVNGFFRPMEHGYVTQGYHGCKYFNRRTNMCTGHIGIDLSSSDKRIKIYPIAPGYVTATYYDSAGALVVKIKHKYNGRYIYSTYAHLRSFSVRAGQYVSIYDSIGRMGSTGYSTGPHLHLEITTCDWKSPGGGCSWPTYAKTSSRDPRNYVEIPHRWNNR